MNFKKDDNNLLQSYNGLFKESKDKIKQENLKQNIIPLINELNQIFKILKNYCKTLYIQKIISLILFWVIILKNLNKANIKILMNL